MRGSPPRPVLRGAATLVLVLSIWNTAPAWATHDVRRFELDANAFDGSAAGEDWSRVAPADRSTENIVASFRADAPEPLDRSYFTGGGSKDLNDVPDWAYTPGDVAPDKNEITNAFAVAYRNRVDTGRTDTGDLLFFFGLDRFANNGDAQVGFWFFRSAVGMRSGGTFSGRHSVGDILVLSHFTQGGRVSDVNVYAWVGSGGSDGTLDLVANGRECADAADDDPVCAAVNSSNTPSAWSYEPKSGDSRTYSSGSFFEAGINVSRLVPGVECFSSFMAETRTSQSVTAQLKDLVLAPFDTCPTVASPPDGPGSPSITGAPRPSLPATGSTTGTLALVGLFSLAFGAAVRLTADRSIRVSRVAVLAAFRWQRSGSMLMGCAAGFDQMRRWAELGSAVKPEPVRRTRRRPAAEPRRSPRSGR